MKYKNWEEIHRENLEQIKNSLEKIPIKFGYHSPNLNSQQIFELPNSGTIFPINESLFVLKYVERIRENEYESGYWVGSGIPGYGQEWVSESKANSSFEDDDYFFHSKKTSVSGTKIRHETIYFFGGNQKGNLFMKKINQSLVEKLKDDTDIFLSEALD